MYIHIIIYTHQVVVNVVTLLEFAIDIVYSVHIIPNEVINDIGRGH